MAKTVKDAYGEILRLRNEFYQKWQEAPQYDESRGAYKAKYEAFDKALELLTPSIVDSQLENPVSEDMDKAAENVASNLAPTHPDVGWNECYDAILAGFKAGVKWDRQLLTKNAVKGVVHHFGDDEIAAIHYNDPKGVPMSYFISSDSLKAGDNVKLITIKED